MRSMLLQITHLTSYQYTPQVMSAQHVAHLLPRHTPAQTVQRSDLFIAPQPTQRHDQLDAFGNHETTFCLRAPHVQLQVDARSVVRTHPPEWDAQRVRTTPAWDAVQAQCHARSAGPIPEAATWCDPSELVQPHPDFIDFARPCFPPHRPLLEAAIELMHRTHQELEYVAHSTDVSTPALQALRQRRGVCQDFALIMLSCLRALGLPARYVSGYVLTDPHPGSHA